MKRNTWLLWAALSCGWGACGEDMVAGPGSMPVGGSDADGTDGELSADGDDPDVPGDADEPDDDQGGTPGGGGDGTPDDSGDGTSGDGGDGSPGPDAGPAPVDGDDALDAPATGRELLPFLEEKRYEGWAAEPDYHTSSGPHGGAVKVFYSPKAQAALEQGSETFPAGAATVKELTSDGYLYGWAVWTKVQDDAASGQGFYWYELIQGEDGDQVYGDGLGHTDCVYCHAGGPDYFLSENIFKR